jgi:hypothetical protein
MSRLAALRHEPFHWYDVSHGDHKYGDKCVYEVSTPSDHSTVTEYWIAWQKIVWSRPIIGKDTATRPSQSLRDITST